MVVFPYPGGAKKYRKGFEKDEGRRFWWDPPTKAGQVPFLPPGFESRERMLLVEGETDTMAVWQALQGSKYRDEVGVVGLSGTNAWKDRYVEELFGAAHRVFVIFDNDDPYANPDAAKATEKALTQIRKDLGRKARLVKLPQGINDLAEFFQVYDWAALQVLLAKAAEPRMNYPRLDLAKEPGPVDWLIEGLVAAPDITVLYGDGGVSKSMFLQALAVAVANGDPTFMGMPLRKHGRVLYVDEENPEDVVLSRLKKLGLTEQGRENLYYVWYQRIRLDEEPERLIHDVVEWDPVLLAIDSFSRIQIAGENDTDAMNSVFTNGIYPIARDLKVPVVALHHTRKDGRIRGATAIRNAADLSLEVRPYETKEGVLLDTFTMFPDKPRRGQKTHITYQVVGYDAAGNPTDDLDEEVSIQLERRDLEEDAPF